MKTEIQPQDSNPMVMWGKYRKSLFRTTLPVSFQFHHVQMDGGQGARFLDELQKKHKCTIKDTEYDNNIEYYRGKSCFRAN
jgi:chloramphenicol O-acetyltransferase